MHMNLILLLLNRQVISDIFQLHGLQHVRLPCPSLSPGICWNSCPFSRWCHSTIPSSVTSFASCPQSFPASGSFKWVSSSHHVAKALEFQLQHQSFQWILRTDFLRIDWFNLLAVRGTLRSLLQHHSSKASILRHSAFLMVQLSHPHVTTGKTIALTIRNFVGKVMSLLYNMLSIFVITVLPRSKCLWWTWVWANSGR